MTMFVEKITSRRALFILELAQQTDDEIKGDIFLKRDETKLPVTRIARENGRTMVYINIESANGEMPLEGGVYELVDSWGENLSFQGQEVTIEIYKNENEYIRAVAMGQEGKLVLQVETKLPRHEQKRFLKRQVQNLFVLTYRLMLLGAKKKGNRVLFASGSREELSGNEKFVYDKICELGLDKELEIEFDFKPSVARTASPVKMLAFLKKLAMADIIFVDDYYPEISKLTFPQRVAVFQLWHACGAFKTVGLERLNKVGAPAINTRVHKQYTHVPVSSDLVAMHYQEAYGLNYNKMYPVGVPRTDIFFDQEYAQQIRNEIFSQYPTLRDADQVIMYAPTFRGVSAVDAYFPMDMINLDKIGDYCQKNNARFIVKMHPFVKERVQVLDNYQKYIIDASTNREINDLLFVSDVLVTDYSSVMYEFSLLGRPMLFYAFDEEEYVRDRDFYEDYRQTVPGRIVGDFDELMSAIEKRDYDTKRLEEFVDRNFKFRDGRASERVVELMEQWRRSHK